MILSFLNWELARKTKKFKRVPKGVKVHNPVTGRVVRGGQPYPKRESPYVRVSELTVAEMKWLRDEGIPFTEISPSTLNRLRQRMKRLERKRQAERDKRPDSPTSAPDLLSPERKSVGLVARVLRKAGLEHVSSEFQREADTEWRAHLRAGREAKASKVKRYEFRYYTEGHDPEKIANQLLTILKKRKWMNIQLESHWETFAEHQTLRTPEGLKKLLAIRRQEGASVSGMGIDINISEPQPWASEVGGVPPGGNRRINWVFYEDRDEAIEGA